MTPQEWVFAFLAVTGAVGAVRLVTSKNVIHAALYLVVALSAVGGIYLLLGTEFVAWTQILIYVGAIVVLLLFSLMLTRAPIGREALDNQQRGTALVVALAIFAGLSLLLLEAFPLAETIHVEPTFTADIGLRMFSTFVLPFEVVSFLLLAALIGAIMLARKDEA